MKTIYLDVTHGAAGDMLLASFIDLGMPIDRLTATISKLGLPHFRLDAVSVVKSGIAATKLNIECPDEHHHRDFKTIKSMIEGSAIEDDVKSLSVAIFKLLAEAEAKVHGKEPADITFHEVGALDSIIDIIGIAAAITHFGVTSAICSAIPMCSGTVSSAHGDIPAMSPAASILLSGQRFYETDICDELITPTAAAVIRYLTQATPEYIDDFSYESIGTGAGSKEFDTHANVMRIFLGESRAASSDRVTVIETNIDDMNPQLFEELFDKLFLIDGVLDASITPVTMKKSRPGFLFKVLLRKDSFERVTETIFKNSTTIGLRYYDIDRVTLDRSFEKIDTAHGEFLVKVSRLKGEIVNVSCEYDELKGACEKLGLSVKELMGDVNLEIEKRYYGKQG